MTKEEFLKEVKYKDNLVTVVAQDYHSKKVRMVAYMNEEALVKTIESGEIYYYSRSRNSLWKKGETSGYYQYLKGMSIDCDGDAILIQIEQLGGISCHTGNSSCFYRSIDEFNKVDNIKESLSNEESFLTKLYKITLDRKINPKEGSYTNYLFNEGINKILKKIGEEASETIIAAKDSKEEVVFEVADLIYHLTVLLVEIGISWDDVKNELEKR